MNVYKYTINYRTIEYRSFGEDAKQLSAEYITLADNIEEARERCWSQFTIAHEYERPHVYNVSGQHITGQFI